MTLEEIQEALRDRRVNVVARETGIHPNTVMNIRDGKTDPIYSNVQKLSEYLSK